MVLSSERKKLKVTTIDLFIENMFPTKGFIMTVVGILTFLRNLKIEMEKTQCGKKFHLSYSQHFVLLIFFLMNYQKLVENIWKNMKRNFYFQWIRVPFLIKKWKLIVSYIKRNFMYFIFVENFLYENTLKTIKMNSFVNSSFKGCSKLLSISSQARDRSKVYLPR